uniref:RING-type domain-containing protein n=1 Tax=Anopheles farauti TaxID=69004 RepID=A0A182Q6B6_9DIPT
MQPSTISHRRHWRQSTETIANDQRHYHRTAVMMGMILLVCLPLPCTRADILVYQMLNDQIIEEFRDLPATFGGEIPDSGMKVLAIRAEPLDGCAAMQPAPANITSKFAVVIARYNCSFEEKVRHAQQAGYAMVIVYNVGSNDLEHMSANHPQDLLIPSVFVGESSGRSIIEAYLYDRDYALVITDDIPFNISNNLIIPFAIVVGLCFMIMVLFMIIRCVRERRRQLRHRLPARVLRRIGIVKFAKGMSFETCAICLEDFVENERLRVLPCRHAYHAICIDPWLTKNRRVCPICKRRVIVRGETRQRRYSSDSMSSTNESTPLLNSSDNNTSVGGGGADAAGAAVVTAPPTTSSSSPTSPGGAATVTANGAPLQSSTPQRDRMQQNATDAATTEAIANSFLVNVPVSDDDDELLDDRNVPSVRWLLRDRTSSSQQQQQQQQQQQNQQQDQQQPLNESPYRPIGDNTSVSFFSNLQRFLPWRSSASHAGDSNPAPATQPQPASSSPTSPSTTTDAALIDTGNNILNVHLSGSFHASNDTFDTDNDLLDSLLRYQRRQRYFRSAPDMMPSTSVGAPQTDRPTGPVVVAALPNVNFNPGAGGGAVPPESSTDGAGSNNRRSGGNGQSRRNRTRKNDRNGNDSHIV